ncbi:FCD domain-containing protein [Pandoraea fibrosis]|uniref:FCD domain-containing protein n=1 Tax=Pandoraea fibrosis TaxID=1891094 RepID=A0ABX6HV72_9BURK|nr:GntR family transcriptional regulator [Pandoraea fibrosis]QHE91625.1 FCD domain-containing protein [Pandoraea fibrosis]QHF14817.1 FCD domain-containing protein [Pandoraea fibrosis]
MNDTREETTLSQRVVRGLTEDIISGRVPSGDKLEIQVIADRFGISATPVRDALRELAIAGLVEIVPRRGATVLSVDVARLRDMFETAAEIEGLCARFAAERMTRSERLRLEMVAKQAHEAADAGDAALYAQINDKFHELLFDGARNVSLAELARSFRVRLSPFRAKLFYQKKRVVSSDNEHERIVEAIVAGKPDDAQNAAREHLSNASLNVIEYFEANA